MRFAAEASQRRSVMAQHFGGFVGEKAAKDEASAWRDELLQMRRELDQRAAQNIRDDKIEVAMNRNERHRRESDRFFDAIEPRVGARILQRRWVDVDCDNLARAVAQQRRHDRQDAGAGAGVEDRLWRVRHDDGLERPKCARGRRMVPGAESLGWLNYDGRSAGFVHPLPWRHDEDSASDPKRAETFHPERGPSRVYDSASAVN